MESEYLKKFEGKKVIITGGLGFIGSNLAKTLTELDTPPKEIVILDCLMSDQGGDLYNIGGLEEKVVVPEIDNGGVNIKNKLKVSAYLENTDYIFNLAGSVSHIGSKKDPLSDLELNAGTHVAFLEACAESVRSKRNNGLLKVVFTSTRDVYGKVREDDLPITEELITREHADPQGIHNQTAEFHHLWHASTHGFQSCCLRLTNTYGPRQKINDPEQGVLGWFIHNALKNEELKLWGGGMIVRDFNYVSDVVDALLMAAASEKTSGEKYNLGSYIISNGKPSIIGGNIKTIAEAAEAVVKISRKGRIKIEQYPIDQKSIEPGHFFADASKFYRATGWKPRASFEEGLAKTIGFYEENRGHYLTSSKAS